MKIPVGKLKPNPEQPRLYFNDIELQELGKDLQIKQLRPLWVLSAVNGGIPLDLQGDEYLIIDGERRWRAATTIGLAELECNPLDMPYVEAYALAVKEHAYRAEHNDVEKARGAIRTYYRFLKQVEGFEMFEENRVPEAAVVSLVVRLQAEKSTPERFPKATLQSRVKSNFEIAIAKAETATGKLRSWVRTTGRDILKIPLPLEQEVAKGEMNIEVAAEIARIDAPEVQQKVVDYAKKEGLTQRKAQRVVSIIKDKDTPKDVKDALLKNKITIDEAQAKVKNIKSQKELTAKKQLRLPLTDAKRGIIVAEGLHAEGVDISSHRGHGTANDISASEPQNTLKADNETQEKRKRAEGVRRFAGESHRQEVSQAREVSARDDTATENIYITLTDWKEFGHSDLLIPSIESKATFNRTNENIEWSKWTWNPVTGCEHGCEYCYASDIATRFYKHKFEPTFHPSRLMATENTRLPQLRDMGYHNVFVCSMADLFGDWVPEEWIDAVLRACRKSPQWNFLFLTKNPKRYIDIEWPDNAWIGTTVDTQARAQAAEDIFKRINAPVKFLSCEPLLGELTFSSLDMFDWIIIGGQSKSSRLPAFQPEWEWVENLLWQARESGCKVYFKPNLTVAPKEYPEGKGRVF